MRKLTFLTPIFSMIAIILELLPNGILMLFANPEGEPFRSYCSYFNLLPFGYADFAPRLTAICTCGALILSLICIIRPKKRSFTVLCVFSALALLFSLFITLSFRRATFINPLVSASLLVNSIIAILLSKKAERSKL